MMKQMTPDELREAILQLPSIGSTKTTKRFTWLYKRCSLRETILSKADSTRFMEWPVILESFHTGWTPYIQSMYDELSSRFREAAMVPLFGGGTRHTSGATGTSVVQAWYLQELENHTGTQIDKLTGRYPPKIHEFGGGYGSMAVVLRKLGFTGLHEIVDFPEVELLRHYYLSNINHANLYTTSPHSIGLAVPTTIFIALCSLSEVAPQERGNFISLGADIYLISYQENFGEINNVEWFKNWELMREGDLLSYDWIDTKHPYIPKHRYLIVYKR